MLGIHSRTTTLAVMPHLLANTNQTRGMATLKELLHRLKSVTSIRKITLAMKLVSAAKYARAERDLRKARSFGLGAQAFYRQAELDVPEGEAPSQKPGTLIFAVTSDRGLCGGVHSSVARKVRQIMDTDAEPGNIKIVCIGDKSKLMLARRFPKNILMMFNNFGRKPPQFGDAVTVATNVLDSGFEFDRGVILYNQFKSVVSYNTSQIPIFSSKLITTSPKMHLYDSVDDEVLKSYFEYSLTSLIYFAMKENACSEQSSRMTAMDTASKNAGEMLHKLTLNYNRTRQSVLTTELIEIISGADALKQA